MTAATIALATLLVSSAQSSAPTPSPRVKKTSTHKAPAKKTTKSRLGKKHPKKKIPTLHLDSSKRTPVTTTGPQLPAGANKPKTASARTPGLMPPAKLEFDFGEPTSNTLNASASSGKLSIGPWSFGGLSLGSDGWISLHATKHWLQDGDIRVECEGGFGNRSNDAIELTVVTYSQQNGSEGIATLRLERPSSNVKALLLMSELSHDYHRLSIRLRRPDYEGSSFKITGCSLERVAKQP